MIDFLIKRIDYRFNDNRKCHYIYIMLYHVLTVMGPIVVCRYNIVVGMLLMVWLVVSAVLYVNVEYDEDRDVLKLVYWMNILYVFWMIPTYNIMVVVSKLYKFIKGE